MLNHGRKVIVTFLLFTLTVFIKKEDKTIVTMAHFEILNTQ